MEMPGRKVSSIGLSGAIAIIAVWILHDIIKIEMPPEVISAATTIIGCLTGYFVPEKDD